MKAFKLLFISILLIWGASTSSAQAQRSGELIPVIESAESVFLTAIQAFEDQDFETAARLFGVVANTFDLHSKTTAALLMRGKSFYMNQEYDQAIQVLGDFTSTYRTSRYVADAEEIIRLATDGTDSNYIDTQILKLGIALPLNSESSALTQQMFNGIRMAVEEHNAVSYDSLMGPTRKIKMIFRDTQNDQGAAQEAIRSLAREQVDAIIGPLFSREALAAAQIAELEQVVMIAPLATDDAVSRDKQYIFQANPSIATRGRVMARFAVYGLGLNDIGILADYSNNESMRMARAFEDEINTLDKGDVVFREAINDPSSWFRLSESVSKDTLLKADAIYLPINGGNASTLIGGALTSLDRMGFGSRLRLLGNVEWHDISQVSLAGNYNTTYSNDFYVSPNDSLAQAFQDRYIAQTGSPPNTWQLILSGYDVTTFIAHQLDRKVFENRPLDFLIRQAPMFEGHGIRLDFSKGNVNEAMFYHQYSAGLLNLLR